MLLSDFLFPRFFVGLDVAIMLNYYDSLTITRDIKIDADSTGSKRIDFLTHNYVFIFFCALEHFPASISTNAPGVKAY